MGESYTIAVLSIVQPRHKKWSEIDFLKNLSAAGLRPTEHAVADKHKVGSSSFCDALIVTAMGILQWLTALWRAVGGNAGNGFPSISSDRITLNSAWRRLWSGVVISVFL